MMNSASITALAATLLALGAVGCAPEGATAQNTGDAATPAAGAGAVAAGAASGIQDCADVQRLDPAVGDSVTTICEIKLSGLDEGSSFKVELISGTVTDMGMPGEDSMVRVTKMVGTDPGQVIEEAGVSLLVPPTYKDVSGDGEPDLLITRDVGNVNAVEAVWLGSPDGAPLYRAGEVAGEFGPPTADGYLPVSARSSAVSQCVSFYRLAGQDLAVVGSACVTAEDDAATQTTCALEDTSGLAAVNLSEEAAKAKFCAEPTVVGAFQ